MSELKYKCQFCGAGTNFSDWHGKTCAGCYGKAFPPATPIYPLQPIQPLLPYMPKNPYYPPIVTWC